MYPYHGWRRFLEAIFMQEWLGIIYLHTEEIDYIYICVYIYIYIYEHTYIHTHTHTHTHIYIYICCCLGANSCIPSCDPMDYSPPGSSVHGISQERRLEWAVISFSRGSSWLKDPTNFSCTTGRFFTTEPQGKPYTYKTYIINNRFSSHLHVVEIEVLTHQVLILWCVYVYIYIYIYTYC